MDLLVADGAHLLGVTILYIESILTLEEYISCKLFGKFALILLLEIDEGLLSTRDHFDARNLALAC
jgi:hypothetical protein